MINYLKYFFFFLLTFLLGVQVSYAKTELVLPQNQVSFSIEQSQSFKSSEKVIQPNIGFIKEKSTFVTVQYNSAVNTYNFSEYFVSSLANAVGKQFDFPLSWLPNRVITGNLDNPKGIIGVYKRQLPNGTWVKDTKNALADVNFPETYASNFVDASKEGYKMLNTNQFYYSNPDQFWTQFNIPWLDGLKASKADVVVLSDKANDLLKYKWTKNDLTGKAVFDINPTTGEQILTGFGKEIQYMDNLVQQGLYQWDSVKGIYKYIGN